MGSIGLISSIFGLESLILPSENNLMTFYFGEVFYFDNLYSTKIINFDNIQFANAPFSIFGDMSVPSYLATPNDDHNWAISNSLEKSYFNSFRLEKSSSDFIGSDTNKY